MTLSDYTHLKNQIIIAVGSNERHLQLLATLKDLFRSDINSPRRFEQIKNIGKLLDVLELRNVLSEGNVGALKRMAEFLPNTADLTTKITQYERSYVPRENGNYYAQERTQYPLQRESVSIPTNNPYGQNHISQKKEQRILDTVVSEIGNNWRDLARNLGIREWIINEIDHNHRSLASKAGKLLNVYLEQKADPDKWFFELCEALDKSRRRDLTKSITKVLTMNI